MDRKQRTCTCDDYDFPHRYGGGKCNEPERKEERDMREWLAGMTPRQCQEWQRACDANVD